MPMTEKEALQLMLDHAEGNAEPPVLEAFTILRQMIENRQRAEDEAAKPHTHKLVASRYHQPYTQEHKSLEDAVGAAFWGKEDNHFNPCQITDMQGTIILQGIELDEAMDRYGESVHTWGDIHTIETPDPKEANGDQCI